MSDIKKEISERLKEFLDESYKNSYGWVKKFATDIKFKDAQSVYPYLNGTSLFGAEKLAELAQLGCDINWLLTGQSYKSPEAEEMDKKDRERLDKLEKAVLELSETNNKLLEHLRSIDREQRNFRGKIKELESKNGF